MEQIRILSVLPLEQRHMDYLEKQAGLVYLLPYMPEKQRDLKVYGQQLNSEHQE